MPKIRDRRREYEELHRVLGLCEKCPTGALPGFGGYCFRHWLLKMFQKRGLTKGILIEKNRKLRELLVASLWGRYSAIAGGFLEPVGPEQCLIDSMEIRARLGIGWAGQAGVRKLAGVMGSVERHAMRSRKEQNGLVHD